MHLRKVSGVSLLIVAFALLISAQEPTVEYGQPEELRGVTKVFVDTGTDAQQRNLIVREIQKKLPTLTVVSRPEEADVHLLFTPRKGVGTIVRVMSRNRVRILLSINTDVPPIFDRESIINYGIETGKPYRLVWEFVKAYKKANG